jgi:hypothetical protein
MHSRAALKLIVSNGSKLGSFNSNPSCSIATPRSRGTTLPESLDIQEMTAALRLLQRTRPDQVAHLVGLAKRLARAANGS